jgi:hypothetical protein
MGVYLVTLLERLDLKARAVVYHQSVEAPIGNFGSVELFITPRDGKVMMKAGNRDTKVTGYVSLVNDETIIKDIRKGIQNAIDAKVKKLTKRANQLTKLRGKFDEVEET